MNGTRHLAKRHIAKAEESYEFISADAPF